MELPKLNFMNYISRFGDFVLNPLKARQNDRVKALILTIVVSIFSLGSVPATLFIMNKISKRTAPKAEEDKKISDKAQEILQQEGKKTTESAQETMQQEDKKTSESAQEVEQKDVFQPRKKTKSRNLSIVEYLEMHANIPQESLPFLAQAEELHHLDQLKSQSKPVLKRKPPFRKSLKERIPTDLATAPLMPPPLLKKTSDVKTVIRRSLETSKKKNIQLLIEKKDPLLTKYVLEKMDLIIQNHKKEWEKRKKNQAICFPVSLDVFVDIYFLKDTKEVFVATQKFASGMFNEIVRGYNWETAEEVVCRRRIPIKGLEESLKASSEEKFKINQKINKKRNIDVIKARGCLTFDNQVVTILEKMKGKELQEILENENILKDNHVRSLICSFLNTMYELHSAAIIHGDISPNNLFVDIDDCGQVKTKLFDFDMAEEFEANDLNAFVGKAKLDIIQMGKLIYGVLFRDELKGVEISDRDMKARLNAILKESHDIKNKDLFDVCYQLLNVKIEKKKLNVSLAQILEKIRSTSDE